MFKTDLSYCGLRSMFFLPLINRVMYYKITLTSRGGLKPHELNTIAEHFKKCRNAYLVNEYGDSGTNSHVEGVVEMDTENTSNVTCGIKRCYEKIGIEVIPFITIQVKKATHMIGALIYASKEVRGNGQVILLKGWEQSFIDKLVKENVARIPYKMLKKRAIESHRARLAH